MEEGREAEVSRQIAESYRRVPQQSARDVWGDLDAWTERNARRNLAALSREEETSDR